MIGFDRTGRETGPDMCVPCGDGLLNIRVGALIVQDGKILMVQSGHDYLYSVGGRIKMGETAEEAVVREVFEETGVRMRIKRLIAVHENYFYGDMPINQGMWVIVCWTERNSSERGFIRMFSVNSNSKVS